MPDQSKPRQAKLDFFERTHDAESVNPEESFLTLPGAEASECQEPPPVDANVDKFIQNEANESADETSKANENGPDTTDASSGQALRDIFAAPPAALTDEVSGLIRIDFLSPDVVAEMVAREKAEAEAAKRKAHPKRKSEKGADN